MATQIGNKKVDKTSYGTAGAYDNSQFGQGESGRAKVRWLQYQMYANGMPSVAKQIQDKRAFDGKFGKTTSEYFNKQGWEISNGGDTLTRNGRTYNWDPTRNEYIEVISQSPEPVKQEAKQFKNYHPGTILSIPMTGINIHGLSDEEAARREAGWRLSLDNESQWTDQRYRDMSNWMRLHPDKTEQDFVDMINRMHTGNMNQIEAASVMGSAVTSLMNIAAGAGQGKTTRQFKYKKPEVILKSRTDKVLAGNGKPAPRKPYITATVDGKNTSIGTSGPAGTKYTPGASKLERPNAYTAGATRGGKRLGGKYTTEHPIEVGTQNLASYVPTNAQEPQAPEFNTGFWEMAKNASKGFVDWLNYSGEDTPHIAGTNKRKNGGKLTLIPRKQL